MQSKCRRPSGQVPVTPFPREDAKEEENGDSHHRSIFQRVPCSLTRRAKLRRAAHRKGVFGERLLFWAGGESRERGRLTGGGERGRVGGKE
jgi:hypothetical protein